MAEFKRGWRPQSVRARTTLAATVVVTLALVAAGILVVALLRDNLYGRAELTAEVNARSVAGQLASGVDPATLDLPDDEEAVQVVDADGRLLASSEELTGDGPVADFAPPSDDGSSPPEDQDDQDDQADSDDSDDGGDDDRDDESGESDDDSAESGAVGSEVTYATLNVPGEEAFYRFAAITADTPNGEVLTVYSGASLETQEEAVDSVAAAMLWALPALLAVVAVVTWLVTRRALRPVRAIQSELVEITGGDLSRRVPVPDSRDEIHDLAVTTNFTLGALDAAESQQRQFVADASHELRSPLAILRTQIEIAQDHPDLLDLEATLADVIRLQDLAADLLLLARLDAGERPPHVAVPFTELVREEVARRAAAERVPVRLELEEDLTVTGVRNHLSRVIANLLDNAGRHSRGAVAVRLAAEDDGWLRLEIADDGNGVPVEERARIFDRFVRLDESRSRDDGGAGLGLAIVRDVVSAHGGAIEVADAPEGGAMFTIRLPRT
ncbi:sensor histidine kinase [Glycomyces buryatensis]|uniref:histidine kinase n=1 Tax=Glycomyces buryatensis TaxID=2570927 RepID=A0A4S8PVL0_9ACTN|nr:HAMP domain-containing sensor histidine kinase [Glycomyces buryatensis]THV35613.1 HAMP domain-containing histidine kinase [Glycomyces buryatensis]